MKNWKLWCFVVLAFGFSLTVPLSAEELAPLFLPEVLETAGCERCLGFYSTSPGGGAASAWGFGATCAAAQADLAAQLQTQGDNKCSSLGYWDGACMLNVQVTAPCWWNASYGSYQVDGYATHKCTQYIC